MGGDIGMLGYLIEQLAAICGWGIPILIVLIGGGVLIKKKLDSSN